MAYSYTLSPFSDEVQRAYLGLLPHQSAAIERGKLSWKFKASPGGVGFAATASEGSRIVGLNAFMTVRMRISDEIVTGYQSMDTIVADEARGKGVFPKLVNCFYDRAAGGFIYGFPNASSSPGFFHKLGWTNLGSVPLLFRPLRTSFFLRRLPLPLPDLPLPYFGRRTTAMRSLAASDVEQMGKAWTRFSEGVRCAVERDAAYLKWRIFDHPTERYKVLGDGAGSFVVGSIAKKHGGTLGYVVEAIGSNPGLSRLIAAMIDDHRRAGADAVLAWCPKWAPNYRAYRSAGLYPLPDRFRPIEINFGARPLKEGFAEVRERTNWYISYLDSDTV